MPHVEQPQRILLVEDEAIIARDLKRRLERLGYEVVDIADNGADALLLARKHRPTFVFMDIVIQGDMDGIETATALQRQMDVPIVFLTAHADEATIQRAKRATPYGYLVKPFEDRELRTTVEMAVARHRVEATARLLEHGISCATVGVAIIDATLPGLPVIRCNPAFERMTGYDGDEVLRQPAGFLFGPETSPEGKETLLRAMSQKQGCALTLQMHRKDGSAFWNELVLSPVSDSSGEVTHHICLHTDDTERRQTEQPLLQAQKMEVVGQLTGGVAHDFNTILTVILSFTEFAQIGMAHDDPRREDLDQVLRAAEKATDLTRQLLAFSRQQPTTQRPTDVNRSLADLAPMLRRSVGPSVDVQLMPSARPAIVRIAPVQLDQVILNLAVNARDAMPQGGHLRMSVSHGSDEGFGTTKGRSVRISVSDSGTGMDAATKQRIFEPFFTTNGVGKGTGLGLATCNGIVTDAGGRLHVETAIGEGTTFVIHLPECDEPLDDSAAIPVASLTGAGQHVLVVDDDPSLRTAAARILENAGYRVTLASDGEQAIARLEAIGREIDLIVTDIVMPGHNGFAVARHAQAAAPQAAVVFATGYVDSESLSEQDVSRLLWKPYTRDGLLRAAHRALVGLEQRNGESSVSSMEARSARVLVVEDDELIQAALIRILEGEGYRTTRADGVATARAALESGDHFDAVLCDLTLKDGSGAELLDWMQQAHPELGQRTLVLTGGAVDNAGIALVDRLGVNVVHKPFDPTVVLERLRALTRPRQHAVEVTAPATPIGIAREPEVRPAKSVLLVEDDPREREACTRALQLADFEVHVARNGEEAVEALSKRSFDVVATDVRLPGDDGFAVLRAARRIDPDLPVLIITGAPSVETATLAATNRAIGYLSKPFAGDQLIEELSRAVEAGQVARVQRKLIASRAGADVFLRDLPGTERAFEQALEGLRMVFQPIVRARDRSVYGYEALLRVNAPGIDNPPRLLTAAELLERTDDVGRRVRTAIAEALREKDLASESIFVNIHPTELRSDLLCSAYEPLLERALQVVLEVTERAALSFDSHIMDDVNRIRSAGYRIAIDDLGEGYAGLTWLAQLQPDVAKLDMSLIRDIHRSQLKRQVTGSLVGLCRRAGITCIAEGVETEEEAAVVTDLGCDLLQGYLIARPGPAFPVVTSHTQPRSQR